MAIVPGLPSKLPLKRDLWGDPLTVNKGLWVTDQNNIVDREVARLSDESGVYLGSPSPMVQGVDLRDITMKDGRNAYDAYREVAANPGKGVNSLKQVAARIIRRRATGTRRMARRPRAGPRRGCSRGRLQSSARRPAGGCSRTRTCGRRS